MDFTGTPIYDGYEDELSTKLGYKKFKKICSISFYNAFWKIYIIQFYVK